MVRVINRQRRTTIMSKYTRYYEKHKEAVRQRNKIRDQRPDVKEYNKQRGIDRRLKHRQILEERLGGKCVKCGTNEQLQFDHIHPGDKCFNITSKINCQLNEEIFQEVDKCQLLCKSCHKEITSQQKRIAWNLLCQLSKEELLSLMRR